MHDDEIRCRFYFKHEKSNKWYIYWQFIESPAVIMKRIGRNTT